MVYQKKPKTYFINSISVGSKITVKTRKEINIIASKEKDSYNNIDSFGVHCFDILMNRSMYDLAGETFTVKNIINVATNAYVAVEENSWRWSIDMLQNTSQNIPMNKFWIGYDTVSDLSEV